jgi:NAD(P)H-hydrate epimerase
MYIYNAAQIRGWDAFTIDREPVASIDLMERSSIAVVQWIIENYPLQKQFYIYCGPGNNGGDGLSIGRQLQDLDCTVQIYVLPSDRYSKDHQEQARRLQANNFPVTMLESESDFGEMAPDIIIIDALYGTGLTRPVTGLPARLIDWINSLPNKVISIDMPSGLPAGSIPENSEVVQADHTLSFQCPKLAFFASENEKFTGVWTLLNIGLHKAYTLFETSIYTYVNEDFAKTVLPSARPVHAFKANFGHACILAGSEAMAGAALLSAGGCLRSGVGLLTLGIPETANMAANILYPEAMCAAKNQWMQHAFYEKKTAVAAGMGWVKDEYHGHLLKWLISNVSAPLVLDATALQIIADHKDHLLARPKGSITVLTPHIGEFRRLTGSVAPSFDRLEKAREMASTYQVFIILKGAFTQIITPGGLVYFNGSGNPGMAKGGSGDALAGLLAGLLAQNVNPIEALITGVYLHGLAGDLAAQHFTQPGMQITDLIAAIPEAWKQLLR